MKTELLTACDQLVTAVVNGIGTGIVLVVLVSCSLRAFGRSNAATRHVLWFGTLMLLVTLVPAHLWLERSASRLRKPSTGRSPETVAANRGRVSADGVALVEAAAAFDSPIPDGAPLPRPGLKGPAVEPSLAPEMEVGTSYKSLGATLLSRAQSVLDPVSVDFNLKPKIPPVTGSVLVGIWFAIAGLKLPLIVRRLNGIRKLKKSSLPANAELTALFSRLRTKLAVSRSVELRESHAVRSALVLGFIRPVVLYPVAKGQSLDLEAAEPVLEHELAHVRRFDDWVNLIQHCIQATLFFHPAVWWVSKQLALEREIACDDVVLQQGGRPQAYALLLVNLAGQRQGWQPLLAPGVSTGKRQLQKRITMILNAQRNTSPRLAKAKLGLITTATTMAAALALYAGPRLVLAENVTSASTGTQPEISLDTAAAPRIELRFDSTPEVTVEAVLAEVAPPATPGPDDVDPGPKIKSSDSPEEEVPRVAKPPRQPKNPRVAVARTPRPPEPVRPRSNIEERLERVERMVQSLMAQRNASHEHPEIHAKELKNLKQLADPEAMEELKAEVRREHSRVMELEKRALKEAGKALKFDHELRTKGPLPEGFEKQMHALEQQRETLEREMEKLGRQMERLAREHERMHDEALRRQINENEDSKE